MTEFDKISALLNDNKTSEAIELLAPALEGKFPDARAWYYMAVAKMAVRDYDYSIKCLEKALEINPASEDALYLMGICLASYGRTDLALAYFQKLKEINPNHPILMN